VTGASESFGRKKVARGRREANAARWRSSAGMKRSSWQSPYVVPLVVWFQWMCGFELMVGGPGLSELVRVGLVQGWRRPASFGTW